MSAAKKSKLSAKQAGELLAILKTRFESNMSRHWGVGWAGVANKLEANPGALWSLSEMESTGGEPDVVAFDRKSGEFIFVDCSPQSPEGRTSACYDRDALDARKKFKPKTSAMDMADEMGVEMLDEAGYLAMQKLGEFDTKSSSWLKTPPEMRELGGALFGDRRYNRVFIFHNGADSYYSGRGFRAVLKV